MVVAVAHVILVSVLDLVQILLSSSFLGLLFILGICWYRGLELDLDQGLTKKAFRFIFYF